MGNCLRHQSPKTWVGDDWECPEPNKLVKTRSLRGKLSDDEARRRMEVEEESLFGEKRNASCSTEVKIKITKKQLEELLGRVDVQGSSVEQILAQLVNVSDHCNTNQRSWRPVLQSIPEMNSVIDGGDES